MAGLSIERRDRAGPASRASVPGGRLTARERQPPMRNTPPPQSGQVPFVAGLPFFIVIAWGP